MVEIKEMKDGNMKRVQRGNVGGKIHKFPWKRKKGMKEVYFDEFKLLINKVGWLWVSDINFSNIKTNYSEKSSSRQKWKKKWKERLMFMDNYWKSNTKQNWNAFSNVYGTH